MSSTPKFLGHKRESKIIQDLEMDSKEESTQSSFYDINRTIKYCNYSITKNNFIFNNNWENLLHPPKVIVKLSDEKFKLKRNFNFASKNTEKKIPIIKKPTKLNELSKNEKEYLYHIFLMKNYEINDIKTINLVKNIPEKKFHMILDIDSTMIKAVDKREIPLSKKPDDFEIYGMIDSMNRFEFYCRYRPYLFHFIHELKDYFHFYISTLGHENYATKIIADLIKKAQISIPQINIISNKIPGQKLVKSLSEIESLKNNKDELDDTVIIDDIINYWIKPPTFKKEDNEIKQCIKCLIPSKRYVIQSAKGPDADKFGILLHNNIFEDSYNKDLTYSIPVDYSFCIERDKDSENGKKGQFFYLEIFIKKCIKFCLYTGKSLVEVMDFFRKKVFEGCKFNFQFLDNEWMDTIKNLVDELGGNVVTKFDETTHFVFKDEVNREKIKSLRPNQHIISVNWIFQCYFNLFKMDELSK
jgi:hypothetical protein